MVEIMPLRGQEQYFPVSGEKYIYDDSTGAFSVQEVRSIKLRLPRGYAKNWVIVRFLTHYLRSFFTLFFSNMDKLNAELERVEDRGRQDPWTAPDGITYQPGDYAYWVPTHGHAPAGVCPWCLWLEQNFSHGGLPWVVWRAARDPRHIALHLTALFPRGPIGCYCQILPYNEAIKHGAYYKHQKTIIGDNEIVDDAEANQDLVIDRYADMIHELSMADAERLMQQDNEEREVRVEKRMIKLHYESIFDETNYEQWWGDMEPGYKF